MPDTFRDMRCKYTNKKRNCQRLTTFFIRKQAQDLTNINFTVCNSLNLPSASVHKSKQKNRACRRTFHTSGKESKYSGAKSAPFFHSMVLYITVNCLKSSRSFCSSKTLPFNDLNSLFFLLSMSRTRIWSSPTPSSSRCCRNSFFRRNDLPDRRSPVIILMSHGSTGLYSCFYLLSCFTKICHL